MQTVSTAESVQDCGAPCHEEQAAARLVDHHIEALLLEARPAKQEAAAC